MLYEVITDAKTLYIRSGSDLVVALRQGREYTVREVVDLSQGDSKHKVTSISLLSGAYSLLVTHSDGLVSQWFDVV